MNEVTVYEVLQAKGFTGEEAKKLIHGLKENQETASKADLIELKTELKSELKNLEIKFIDSLNKQTNKIVSFAALIVTFMKALDFYTRH